MTLADALGWTGFAIGVLAIALQLTDAKERHVTWGMFAVADWIQFVGNVLGGRPAWAVVDGLFAALFTWLWWKNRPKGRGRKALRELGAKSRAVVESMVEQMTPSPIPSPAGA